MKLRLTMMGRGYDASTTLPSELELPGEAVVDDALAALTNQLPQDQQLPSSCLVVHNGKHLGTIAAHQNAALADEDELVLIAPVAGG
jgi:molybdopterin converting factor small subunit